jgi:hypothetical protein
MVANSLNVYGEIVAILFSGGFLFFWAMTLGLPYITGLQAAQRGHRQKERGEAQQAGLEQRQRGGMTQDEGPEVVGPDGFVDSFAETIEEAGGGLPPVVAITVIGVIIWYIVYVIIFWAPRGYPYMI